ncbi:MAG TPA: hypothetical protein VFO45_06430 [Sphingomicrobium sp.]|nr:hypothetical protein [Sphingomicrobium sp.]
MSIKLLAEVRVDHPFYANGLCADARVMPDPATAARLLGLRVIAKEVVGGLKLFADFADDGTTPVPIPSTDLRFHLLKLPAELEAATDLSAMTPGTLFTDAGPSKPMKPVRGEVRGQESLAKPKGSVAMVLSGRPIEGAATADFHVAQPAQGITIKSFDAAGNKVLMEGPAANVLIDYPVAPPRIPGTLAAIKLRIGPETAVQAAKDKPRRFTVTLKPAAAHWCYHLVTDLADPLDDWRITHPAADGPPVTFGSGGLAEIAAPDADDPFGSQLLLRSAPLRVLRFVSEDPVACSEKRARRLALFAGGRQLFAALPNPPPTNVRLVGGRPAFGEVLRFVTV